MPVILVIIIVAAWIVILGPNLIRRRSNSGNGTTSISHFHRQLQILEHSRPRPSCRRPTGSGRSTAALLPAR